MTDDINEEDPPEPVNKRQLLPKQRWYLKIREKLDKATIRLYEQEEKVRMLKIGVMLAKKDADKEAMLSGLLLGSLDRYPTKD